MALFFDNLGRPAPNAKFMHMKENGKIICTCKFYFNEVEKWDVEKEKKILKRYESPYTIKYFEPPLNLIRNHPKTHVIGFEYYKNGTLREFFSKIDLNADIKNDINGYQMIWAYGIAKGLEIIHMNHTIHHELRLENVLIDDNYYPRIQEFGGQIYKRITDRQNLFLRDVQNLIYLSPEKLRDEECDFSTDIYSYGIIILELLSNQNPFQDIHFYKYHDIIKSDKQPTIPNEIPDTFANLITRCLSAEPTKRPTSKDIVDFFECGNISIHSLSFSKYIVESHSKRDQENLFQEAQKFERDGQYFISYHFALIHESITHSTESQIFLGECYYKGKGIPKDETKAFEYFNEASKQGSIESHFNLGFFYYFGKVVEKDRMKSFKHFKYASDNENSLSHFYVGLFYSTGECATKSETEAIKYYCKYENKKEEVKREDHGLFSLHQNGEDYNKYLTEVLKYYEMLGNAGYVHEQYYTSFCYYKGIGTKQDISKAFYYFKKSAEQDHSESQYYVGLFYYQGKGISQDFCQALKYFMLSSEKGHSGSQYYIGLCYYNGEGVSKNSSEAYKYFQLSADRGHSGSQYYAGLCCYRGEGVTKNYLSLFAFRSFKLSADQGHSEGQYYAGLCYYKGIGVMNNPSEAIKYFKLSADQGHPGSQYYVGLYYYSEEKNELINFEAFDFLKRSAKQGNPELQFYVGLCYYHGVIVVRDIIEAFHYFEIASANGHPYAQFYVGLYYHEGRIITENEEKALEYFDKSAQKGVLESFKYLGEYYAGFYFNAKIDETKRVRYLTMLSELTHMGKIWSIVRHFTRRESIEKFPDISKECKLKLTEKMKKEEGCESFLQSFENSKDFLKAFPPLIYLANNGNIDLQYYVGLSYFNGEKVGKNYSEAFKYFKLSSDQGYSKSHYYVGLFYYHGDGVEQNQSIASKYFKMSVDQGLSQGLLELILYQYQEERYSKALEYFSKSASQNYQKAQYYVNLLVSKQNLR